MSDLVKAAAILGIAIVAATALWVYFSPYQTCVRAQRAHNVPRAETNCAAALGSHG
jgi:hypothetical protein